MRIRNAKNFYPGLIFTAAGLGAMIISGGHYQLGSLAKMGPGLFPLAMGGLLAALGVILAVLGLAAGRPAEERPSFKLKPAALVLSSVVLFGLLLKPLGLIGATFVLVMVSSVASEDFKLRQALLNSLAILAIILVLFVYFLELPLPVWPGR
jgi:hypothetical protein